MNNKTIVAIGIVIIMIIGGISIFTFKSGNSDKEIGANDMSSHHGGGAQTSNDPANTNMDKISFSSVVGQTAPDFTLPKQDGSTFTLSDYKNKTVILFFNEGAMCYPSCWEQIASLANDARFNNDDIIVASIVVDTKEQWDKIMSSQAKFQSAAILLDTNKAVSKAYDVLNLQSSMHKGIMPGHTYYVMKNGVITFVLDDPNMGINNDVLAAKI